MSLPRYPEYRDSGVEWLGEVPASWSVSPMKRLLDIQNGADYKQVEAEEGFPVIGSGGAFAFASDYLFDGEAVLLGRKGTIDRPLHVKGKFWTVDTMYWSRIRPGVCGRFAYYAAMTIPFGLYSTNTALPSMTKAALDNHRVPVPSLVEQRAISEFLDRETAKIAALIAEQEKLLALLAEKRQATISHAVTRGLDPNVPMKDSGIPWLGEVPAHWDVCPFKYVGCVGNGSTPNRDNPSYWGQSGFPWLNSAAVNQREVAEAERFVTELALKECHLPVIQPPAVLVGLTGQGKTRGMAAQLMFKTTISQHLAYMIPDSERLHVSYLLRAVETAYERLRDDSEGVGSTKGAITCDQLSRLELPLPPLDEQHAIVERLGMKSAEFDSLVEESMRGIALLKDRRSALISAAVTGQIDVRELVNREAA